jgi:calcineurin-like phosphoesterase family protein
MLYFTSDWHVGHENVIKFCERPFKDLDEMHEALIDNYNSVVTDKDEVWFLGDLVLRATDEQCKLYGKLRGRKHVVWGNHDKKQRHQLEVYFESAQDYKELKYNKHRFILMHFPIHSWNGRNRGSWHLHGHSHGTLPFDNTLKRLDVGVDVHNFTPISYEQIEVIFNDITNA